MLHCAVSISAKHALALRDLGVELDFRCPNAACNQPVFPVREGKDNKGIIYSAHFEHRKRNRDCPFGVGIKIAPEVLVTASEPKPAQS
jgi:hypothetical protein